MKRALCEQSSENKENRSDPGNMPQAAGGRRTKVKRGAGVDVRDELYTSLIEQLECPICMHPYTERVFVCRNGHSICGHCYGHVKKKCPSCRTQLTGARNQAIESIVATAILPCRHAEYGCTFRGKGPERAKHKEHCVYQPVGCLFHRCYPNCRWIGPPSALLEHLNSHCTVRNGRLGEVSDVFWSYENKERCFMRGKDATFYLPEVERFYYVSISKRDGRFHLVVVWLPTTDKAANPERKIKMNVTFPIVEDQSIDFTIRPPRLTPGTMMDPMVKSLIQNGDSYVLPIKRWRSQWLEARNKFYFRISAAWKLDKASPSSSGPRRI